MSYETEQNRTDLATVTFNGNGLYFNNDPEQTTNVVKYVPGEISETKYSHTANLNDAGEVIDSSWPNCMYPLDTNETFTYEFPNMDNMHVKLVRTGEDGGCPRDNDDYFSLWTGIHPDYTAKVNYTVAEKIFGNTDGKYVFGEYARDGELTTNLGGNTVTFAYTTNDSRDGYCGNSGYGYYATIIGYTNNMIIFNEYLVPSTAAINEYQFLGWSSEPDTGVVQYAPDTDFVNPNTFTINANDTITLYAIWTPAPFSIAYDGNDATAGSMQSTDDNNITVALGYQDVILSDTIDLYAPNYKKDGYGFVGWSIDKDAWTHLTNDDTSDDPTIYGPNQTVTIDKYIVNALDEKTNTVTLYAVWSPAEKDLQGNPVYLQHWTGCSALTPTNYDVDTNTLNVGNNTVTALTDNRDGNVYTIARLADGNCWMVENLRLDDTATITVSNTNNPLVVNGMVAIKNNNGNTYSHLSSNSSSWCSDDWGSESCRGRSYLSTNNTNLGGSGMVASYNSSDYSSQWYSYGNYYNWYSATVGRGKYDIGAGMTASGDICPIGWQLPYGGYDNKDTNGSFMHLNQQLGNTSSDGYNWLVFPNNFIRAGVFVENQSLSYRGELGAYWSSVHMDSSFNASAAWLNSSGTMWASGHTPDSRGGSVRCVTLAE